MVSPLAPQQFAPAQNFGQQLLGAVAQGQGVAQNRQNMAMNNQAMQMRETGQQQQVSEYDYMTGVRRLEVINRLAKHARSLSTPQEREQFKQSISPEVLQSVGIDPAQLAQTPIDDRGLDSLIAQTQAALPQQNQQQYRKESVNTNEGLMVFDPVSGTYKQATGPDGKALKGAQYDPDLQAEISGAKSGASEGAKLDEQLNKLPEVKAAVASAVQQVKELGDKRTKSASDTIAMTMYETAMQGLIRGLEGTNTGYIAGRLPAVTANQQIAEGGVAAMAPILKSMFRVSGEGTFTDKDQELLMQMVPTRKDSKEAIASKINNINAIVAAKLSAAGQQPPAAPMQSAPQEQPATQSIEDLLRMY